MMRVYISIPHLEGSGSMPTLFKFTPDSAELALNYLVPQLCFFELVYLVIHAIGCQSSITS